MIILSIILLILIVFAKILFPFVANTFASIDLFFTKLESGNIKYIMRGKSLMKIITSTLSNQISIDNNLGVSIEGIENRSKFTKKYGLYWIGIPPFGKIHKFKISKERENPNGKSPEDWIEKSTDEVEVSELRFTFPRPFLLTNVELKDRLPIDLLVVAKFEVVDAYIPVFNFKGKFFENAGSIIRSAVIDILKEYDIESFVKAPKDEVDGILKKLKEKDSDFNVELIKQVGLRLVGISIPQYDPSDREMREAMNAKAIAEKLGEGVIANANIYAKEVEIKTTADASRIEKLGTAEGEKVLKLTTTLATIGAKPAEIAKATAEILKAEKIAGPDSKITTYVESGDSSKIVIPTGGEK